MPLALSNVIEGEITHQNSPLAYIDVALITGNTCNTSFVIDTTQTDENGVYTFNNVDPGAYRVAFNGWDGTGVITVPYEQTCSWDIYKNDGERLFFDWTLNKTDLFITYPSDYETIFGTNSPIISWQDYPGAVSYKVVITQQSPVSESIAFLEPSNGTTYQHPAPLPAGATFQLVVWAYDTYGGQIASGSHIFYTP